MVYGDIQTVRNYTGLKENDLSDAVLMEYLEDANRLFLEDIAVKEVRAELKNIGEEEYQLPKYPVADSNFDKIVDEDDIILEVHDMGSGLYYTVEPESFDPFLGIVTLDDKLDPDKRLVATYYWYVSEDAYPSSEDDWSKMDLACSVLAGYLAISSRYLFLPYNLALGTLRISYGARAMNPQNRLLTLYLEILNTINKSRTFKG